jgi:hypothetical protein
MRRCKNGFQAWDSQFISHTFNSDPCPVLTACASRYLAGNVGDSDAALTQLVATLE